jgi:hypothetical protein
MPGWKVFLIGVCACVCFGLAGATALAPMTHEGGERWAWMGGLLVATLIAGALFTLFLRHASGSLDTKTRGSRY